MRREVPLEIHQLTSIAASPIRSTGEELLLKVADFEPTILPVDSIDLTQTSMARQMFNRTWTANSSSSRVQAPAETVRQ